MPSQSSERRPRILSIESLDGVGCGGNLLKHQPVLILAKRVGIANIEGERWGLAQW
jgi:hypothetical protein